MLKCTCTTTLTPKVLLITANVFVKFSPLLANRRSGDWRRLNPDSAVETLVLLSTRTARAVRSSRILGDPIWKAQIWFVLSWSQYDTRAQHHFKRKEQSLLSSRDTELCSVFTGPGQYFFIKASKKNNGCPADWSVRVNHFSSDVSCCLNDQSEASLS